MNMSDVKIHPAIRDVEHLVRLVNDPESVGKSERFWIGPNYLDFGFEDGRGTFYWGMSGQGGYQPGLTASEVVAAIAPIFERPELAWTCGSCGARVGQPCTKRSNRQDGGPSHLTRADKFGRFERRHAPALSETARAAHPAGKGRTASEIEEDGTEGSR